MSSCGRNSGCTAPLTILPIQPGFHGASIGAVAREAGVATGTAYTHYASKDDLVLAAYCETKAQLAAAAMNSLDDSAPAPAGILAYRPEPGQVGQARAREYGVGEEGLTAPSQPAPRS